MEKSNRTLTGSLRNITRTVKNIVWKSKENPMDNPICNHRQFSGNLRNITRNLRTIIGQKRDNPIEQSNGHKGNSQETLG